MSTGIGVRVPRKEDARHLAGKAQFVGDLSFPRLWEVAFVRSPLAHARIRSVTVPERYAGRVFTAADMEGVRPIRAESSLPTYKPSDWPALARGKVRFAGECVALCIAPTRAEAEDIAEAVELDLEPLPAVTDSLAARRPDAPLVHDEWSDNLFLTTSADGDIESVRERAAVVIEREYRTARQCMVPLEGKAVLARHDERNEQLVVYTSTQVPHLIRTGLSQTLGLDQADVRVIAPDVGGGFGYKCVLQPEEISVSWAAMRTGRPLRWVEDRREHLTAGANTHGLSPVELLDECGLLDARLVAAHCIFLDPPDIARAGASGLTVAHAPIGNLRAGNVAPILDLEAAGARIALCTDTMSGDLFEAMRTAIATARIQAEETAPSRPPISMPGKPSAGRPAPARPRSDSRTWSAPSKPARRPTSSSSTPPPRASRRSSTVTGSSSTPVPVTMSTRWSSMVGCGSAPVGPSASTGRRSSPPPRPSPIGSGGAMAPFRLPRHRVAACPRTPAGP